MTNYFYLTAFDIANNRREDIFGDFNKKVVEDEYYHERDNLKMQGYKDILIERREYK